MAQELTDREVINQIIDGETDQFQILVDRYKNLVYSLALRMLSDASEADDLAQEAFIRAYRFIHTYKDEFKFSTWISRIVINLFKDRFKRASLPMADEEELAYQADDKNNPEQETMRNIRRADIVSIVGRLDEKYREVVVLYFFEEFSYEEIGEILGLPMGTVKSRLNRAKAILLTEYGGSLEKWRS